MNISDKIFELLKEKGMSQKEFSEKTGIAQSTISDWKRKRTNPVSDKILIISQALDTTPESLLSGTTPDVQRCNENNMVTISVDTEEGKLLYDFQKMDRDQRNRLIGYAKALMEK